MSQSAPSQKHNYVDPAAFTPHFSWKQTEGSDADGIEHLFCEETALSSIARSFGTPTYLYSGAAITDAYHELDGGLGDLPHTLCFAAKSNGNLSILKHLAKLGSGFDIVSGGELDHLGHLGVPGDRIVFSGVGKSRHEIFAALKYSPGKRASRGGILLFNVESEAELEILLEESARHVERGGKIPSLSIRVNPDVQAGGHPHISTGRYQHKFGLDWAAAKRLYLSQKDAKQIRWQGISSHIGSQITSLAPFRSAFRRIASHVQELRRAGIELRYLDFGGGLGVRYTGEKPPARSEYAKMLAGLVRPLGLHLLLEPGRTLIAPAGVLLTRVIYVKENASKTFVIVDAAMNDLIRPSLYGAVHPITPVLRDPKTESGAAKKSASQSRKRVDIVGPVCETGDFFLRDWPLGEVRAGDLLAIWTAGAYGMSLASNYNARGRPSEVLIEGKRCRLIRRRETQDDLLRTDVLAPLKRPRFVKPA